MLSAMNGSINKRILAAALTLAIAAAAAVPALSQAAAVKLGLKEAVDAALSKNVQP